MLTGRSGARETKKGGTRICNAALLEKLLSIGKIELKIEKYKNFHLMAEIDDKTNILLLTKKIAQEC